MSRGPQDILGVLKGLQILAKAVAKQQNEVFKHLWLNSSVRESVESNVRRGSDFMQHASENPFDELKRIQHLLIETRDRLCVVSAGLKEISNLTNFIPRDFIKMSTNPFEQQQKQQPQNSYRGPPPGSPSGPPTSGQSYIDAANLDISSITLKELEEILSRRNRNREVSLRTGETVKKQISTEKPKIVDPKTSIKLVSLEEDKLRDDATYLENMLKMVSGKNSIKATTVADTDETDVLSVSQGTSVNEINLPELNASAKQRRVPSSRIARMASFGGLFAGLGFGTINELTKGVLGFGGSTNVKEALLSPANAERIVNTLCKVRGAALKIGQILSIQDSSVVSPQLAKAFERVRQAADYMPDWQVDSVMNDQLGNDWRDLLDTFDEKPFAAASIGQVHRARLKDGMEVAVKIQYPGVAQSIESDIDNLVGVLKVWDVFPQGFFIDNMVKVAKRELNWEVDYHREAEYTEKFKEMVLSYPEYYVPKVIKELTTSNVLTTELVSGVPLDQCFDLSYEHRKHIAESVMKLCLRELFEVQCMQTDPNWSNFLYDAATQRLMLIDFGSTRFYQREFIKNYRKVIMSAAHNDRKGVLEISREMKFLTGYETKQMDEAHVDAVMILGEIFRYDGDFDFSKQNTTERIVHLVPVMVSHRLCPPPDEIYSIHRKLSGIFLLCSRLKVKMNCRKLYEEIIVGKFKE